MHELKDLNLETKELSFRGGVIVINRGINQTRSHSPSVRAAERDVVILPGGEPPRETSSFFPIDKRAPRERESESSIENRRDSSSIASTERERADRESRSLRSWRRSTDWWWWIVEEKSIDGDGRGGMNCGRWSFIAREREKREPNAHSSTTCPTRSASSSS